MTDTPVGRIEYEEIRERTLLETLLGSRRRSFTFWLTFTACVLAIALGLLHLYVAVFGTPEVRSFRATHLTVMMILAIMLNPLGRTNLGDPVWLPGQTGNGLRAAGFTVDLLLIALVLLVQVYTMWDIVAFNGRLTSYDPDDLLVGGLLILLVLETTRRSVGISMVLVALFFILQTLFSPKFFWIFYGPPTSFGKYIDTQFMSTDGIFGIPLHVAATYIVLFIIFGSILLRSGAGRFFIDLAVAVTGHRVGGPAKAAVVSSAFMGTVSGSAVANVVTTGAFTIPMMKRLGYRPKFAAAVEACASSGGQITPPIMGAAAFIIAELLAVPYVTVIIAAAIPAFLYFATIYFMVHFEAEKHGIEKIPKERLPEIGRVLKEGWHFLLALVVLVCLLVYGFTPMMAAFWGIVALVAMSFLNPATRMSPVDLLTALESGVRSTVPVTIACACAGIIIGSVFVSGLGLKFTQSVIDISGGYLFVLLALTALASILLGMGMTTTAVYITVAALIVPSLTNIGVVPMAAHMFAFYFGVVSTITPPVALAAFAGAAIAGTSPMATAVESSRVGIAKYLVPFAFVYNPSLLFEGPLWMTALSTAAVLAAMWFLSVCLEGWLNGRLTVLPRLLALGAAVLLMMPPGASISGLPGYLLIAAGAALGATLYFSRRGRNSQGAKESSKAEPAS